MIKSKSIFDPLEILSGGYMAFKNYTNYFSSVHLSNIFQIKNRKCALSKLHPFLFGWQDISLQNEMFTLKLNKHLKTKGVFGDKCKGYIPVNDLKMSSVSFWGCQSIQCISVAGGYKLPQNPTR